MDGKSIDEIADIMQNLQGIVAFKITPASDTMENQAGIVSL